MTCSPVAGPQDQVQLPLLIEDDLLLGHDDPPS
jgi:hypothetical protein